MKKKCFLEERIEKIIEMQETGYPCDEEILLESENCYEIMNEHSKTYGLELDEDTFKDGFYYGALYAIEFHQRRKSKPHETTTNLQTQSLH